MQAEINRSYTKHRKIASSFRDTQLFEIFELGINLLKKAYEMIKTVDYSDADQVANIRMISVFCNTLPVSHVLLMFKYVKPDSNAAQCGKYSVSATWSYDVLIRHRAAETHETC